MFKKRGWLSGFTLAELLVVISIIGLLASAVLVSVSGLRQRTRDIRRISDLNQLQRAIQAYQIQETQFPSMDASNCYQIDPSCHSLDSLVSKAYFGALPKDPTIGKSYYYYQNLDQGVNPGDQFDYFVVFAYLEAGISQGFNLPASQTDWCATSSFISQTVGNDVYYCVGDSYKLSD